MASAAYVHEAPGHSRFRTFVEVVRAVAAREFKGQYRRSLLGPGWAILQPVAYVLLFVFLRQVVSISSNGIPYVVFTYAALLPWTLFSSGLMRCSASIQGNAAIVKKTDLPREAFPVAAIVVSLIDFAISSSILIGLIFWYRVPLRWPMLWVPVLALVTAFVALGIGLGIAAVGTFRRDVVFVTPFLLQFWLMATPIMYPLQQVPEKWQSLYRLNPMVGVVEGFRNAILVGVAPDVGLLLASIGVAAVIWCITWPTFRYVAQYFADVL